MLLNDLALLHVHRVADNSDDARKFSLTMPFHLDKERTPQVRHLVILSPSRRLDRARMGVGHDMRLSAVPAHYD